MNAHYVEITALAQATEDPDLVKEAMRTLLPEDTDIETEEAEGHFGNPVRLLKARFENAAEIRGFFDKLGPHFRDRVLDQLDSRLDDDCNLWIRLDKDAALDGDVLPARGEGIVARVKLAAFPANRENAEESARDLLAR